MGKGPDKEMCNMYIMYYSETNDDESSQQEICAAHYGSHAFVPEALPKWIVDKLQVKDQSLDSDNKNDP